MMKFINNDYRTREFLQGWQRKDHQVHASFFFHHRGNATQKSFEGLLRSILSQLLENDYSVFTHIMPILRERYLELLKMKGLGDLSSDLRLLILDYAVKADEVLERGVDDILETQLPRKKFYDIVVSNMRAGDATAPAWTLIERYVISRKDEILKATNARELDNMKPPICQGKWDGEAREHFLSLLLQWRDAVDLRGKLENLMQLANAGSKDANTANWSLERRRRLEQVVQRQHDRELLRAAVETEIWSKPKLEKAFRYIIEQQKFDRDLCLFLDALDEYDGPPGFIAEFLKDLVRERKSRTRVRILFSSRPWNVFIDEFHQHPGFRIHEHTLYDVRMFCAQNINHNLPGSEEIIRLIGKIVEESRGVFLWVKLVLHDLTDLAARCIEVGMRGRSLRNKLEEGFNSIPKDLVDYYGAIIDRIPQNYRWHAYCLLESVCRSYKTIQAGEVLDILRCSTITKFSRFRGQPSFASLEEVENHIRAVSGGLLEIVETHTWSRVVPQLQLLHQTMLEYVRRPLFKGKLLGQMSHITVENGHSFLTKYLLYREKCRVTPHLLRHAHESESSTGINAYDLLHQGIFTIMPSGEISPTEVSPIGFAVAGLLHLFIKEALEHDENVIKNAQDSFLSLVLWSFDNSLCEIDEAVAMIHFLSCHGFRVDNDADGLSKIVARDPRGPNFQRPYEPEQYDKMAKAALSRCLDLEMNVPFLPAVLHSKCLHLSSPAVTEHLLNKGANPNSTNSEGQTPLDFLFDVGKTFLGFSTEQLCQKGVLIVQRNGLLCKTHTEAWNDLMRDFNARGFDTSPFRERQFPKWIRQPAQGSSLQRATGFLWPWEG